MRRISLVDAVLAALLRRRGGRQEIARGERLEVKGDRMEELVRMGQQALESQPFTALLGARLAFFSEGEAVLDVPFRDDLWQQDGFVHGGVVSYLADNALAFAGGSVLGPAVLTQEYKIGGLRSPSPRPPHPRAGGFAGAPLRRASRSSNASD